AFNPGMTGWTLRRVAAACAAALLPGACATDSIDPDLGWSARVTPGREPARYRIAVSRAIAYGAGEGEFAVRFDREARRVAEERSCAYKVLTYSERHESRFISSSRVAEGEIECR